MKRHRAILLLTLMLGGFCMPAGAQQASPAADRYLASIEVKDGDVREVLRQLFVRRGVNYIIREGVRGRVTCSFQQFDWELVVRYVARLANAHITRDEAGVYVVELGPEKPAESAATRETQKKPEPDKPKIEEKKNAAPPPFAPIVPSLGPSETQQQPRRRGAGNLARSTIPVNNYQPSLLGALFGANQPVFGSSSYPSFGMGVTTFYPGLIGCGLPFPGGYAMQFYGLYAPHFP